MKAETPSISNVFQSSTKLVIPFFQRSYVWQEPEWERFHQDMVALIGSKNRYFLGSLILKEMDLEDSDSEKGIAQKYMLVDGQQRLTTLSIYLKALHNILPDVTLRASFKTAFYSLDGSLTPVLHHSIDDRPAYINIMQKEAATPIDGLYANSQVAKAYNYFLDKLRPFGNLTSLRNAIYSKIRFVSIILDNQDDEQQIFDSINSLGVDLTVDELMKNFLYENDDQDAYLQNWRPVFDTPTARLFWGTDNAARRQEKNEETKVINSFFYYYVKIKMWDFRDRFEGNDRLEFVKRKNLFSTCKAFHVRFGMAKPDLANDILSYAKLYKQYFDKENLKLRIPANPCIERVACIAIASKSTIIPYVLYVLKNVSDETERNQIFAYLETYLVRRGLALSSSTEDKNFPEFFSETLVGNKLDTFQKLKNYIEAIGEEEHNRMPNDDEVKGGAMNKKQDNENACLLYYLKETKMQSQDTRGLLYYIADRIIPVPNKSNVANWPAPINDRDALEVYKKKVALLGNFVPLRLINDLEQLDMAKKEVSITANKSLTDKKVQYVQKAINLHEQAVLGNLNSWNIKAIESKTKDLVEDYLKTWAI